MARTTEGQLAEDVGKLYESHALSDFVVETSDGMEFRVHRSILASRSKVFMAMLTMEHSKEVLTGRCDITDVDGAIMENLLKYMYGIYKGVDNENALNLLYAAEKYDLAGLVQLCASVLLAKMNNAIAADVLLAADRLKLPDLKESALKTIAKDRREFLRSGQLERIREQSVELMEDVLKGMPNSGKIHTVSVDVRCPCDKAHCRYPVWSGSVKVPYP